MNAARRKEITRAINWLEQAKAIIEAVGKEERDYFDAMPDSLQVSEKDEAADAAATALEEALDAIDEITANLEELRGD